MAITNAYELTPAKVMEEVAMAIPQSHRGNVIIIGSLAAGYHFFGNDPDKAIRTKDVDAMFSPHAMAVGAARHVTEELLQAHWRIREEGDWSTPGTAQTPEDQLPLVRLKPPHEASWFLELMSAPRSDHDGEMVKTHERVETNVGHFALCSFGYLGLAEYEPLSTPWGLKYARPEMMALANLLHHPELGEATISGEFFGKGVKRSNKDLGRVLALAHLSLARDANAMEIWGNEWRDALTTRYPARAAHIMPRVGLGLAALQRSPTDFDEAVTTCSLGLLRAMDVGVDALRATARRMAAEAIAPLEENTDS
jgi:hypothetical protein